MARTAGDSSVLLLDHLLMTISLCRGIPETSRHDEPGRVGRNRVMAGKAQRNVMLQEATESVKWGIANNAQMDDIVQNLINRLENRGVEKVAQDQAIAALEAASIIEGFMEGMPGRYHHLYDQGGNKGW